MQSPRGQIQKAVSGCGSNFQDAPVTWAAFYSHLFTLCTSSFLKVKLRFLQVLRLFFHVIASCPLFFFLRTKKKTISVSAVLLALFRFKSGN